MRTRSEGLGNRPPVVRATPENPDAGKGAREDPGRRPTCATAVALAGARGRVSSVSGKGLVS